MADTVKAPRCTDRAAGTGSRCTLPDGHAAPHTAAGVEWPSEASETLVELHTTRRKLREIAQHLLVDADCPGAAHDPTELLSWFRREFPAAFDPNRQYILRRVPKAK